MNRFLLAGMLAALPLCAERMSPYRCFSNSNGDGAADFSRWQTHRLINESFADITTDRRYSNLWVVNFDGSGDRAA